MAKRFLALNVGASSVALAEYSIAKGAAPALVNYGIAALDAPLDSGSAETILSPALLQIVREKGIKPGPVAIAVPGQMVFPRLASIPEAGGADKFEERILHEVEQNIPFPINEMIWDRHVLGENDAGERNVFIAAAKYEQIEEITSAVKAAGFLPVLVDVSPIAVTNVLKYNLGEADVCSVILDIGAKTTSLVIVDGDRIFNRSIPVAGKTLTKEIGQALGCSPEEAEQMKLERGYVALGGVVEDEDEVTDRVSKVCRAVMTRLHAEISRSINFYRGQQGGAAPVKLYLTGGSAKLPQADRFFAESLQIEVGYLDPFEGISVPAALRAGEFEADALSLAATAGLAIHLADGASFSVDLMPPELIRERRLSAKIPFVAAATAMIVGGLVLFLLGVKHDTEVATASYDAIKVGENSLRSLDQKIKSALDGEQSVEDAAEALARQYRRRYATVNRFNDVLSALGRQGLWIERWEDVDPAVTRVTVRGWRDDVEKYLAGSAKTAAEVFADKLRPMPSVAKKTDKQDSVTVIEMDSVDQADTLRQFKVQVKFNVEEEAK